MTTRRERVLQHSETPASLTLTPLEIANALNEMATSRGWPTLTFYGAPAEAPLT